MLCMCDARAADCRCVVDALPLLLLQQLLHPFNGLFCKTGWVSQCQKCESSLGLNEARDDGVWRCSDISWTACKQSASRFLQAGRSSRLPTSSVKCAVVEISALCVCVNAAGTTTLAQCSGYFRCLSGEFVCAHQQCDGRVDCEDTTDERSCHGNRLIKLARPAAPPA